MPRLAAFLCVIETAWAAWFILPPFAGRGALAPVLSAAALVGGAALLLNRYLTSILRHGLAGEGAP